MTDFYVYRLNAQDKKGDHVLGFIDDTVKFAGQHFKPGQMEFTGVKIIAPDLAAAQYVYANPASDRGDYQVSDEPKATKAVGALASIVDTGNQAILALLAKRLSMINTDLNKTLSLIARAVHNQSNKIIPPDQIYVLLKKKWCNQFPVEAEYHDGRRDKTSDADGNKGEDS